MRPTRKYPRSIDLEEVNNSKLIDKSMGAPGLAFETWDPCNRWFMETQLPCNETIKRGSGRQFRSAGEIMLRAAKIPTILDATLKSS